MKGEYYQCIKCNIYSVHKDDDRICVNQQCTSNINKRKKMVITTQICGMCSTQIGILEKASPEVYNGLCQRCHKNKQTMSATVRGGNGFKNKTGTFDSATHKPKSRKCMRCYTMYPCT